MDKKVKAKWVRALRSGRYKQASQSLYDGSGYCCLGVLCRVLGVEASKIKDGDFPSGVRVKTGLPGVVTRKLARMNDGDYDGLDRKSFREIAAYIEANL